jgi:hypothetical protein
VDLRLAAQAEQKKVFAFDFGQHQGAADPVEYVG